MTLILLDWRRRVSELYAVVREMADADPGMAHEHWRAGRDALFAWHPESPLSAPARNAFTGLPVAPYDPAYRFDVSVDPAAQGEFEAATGTDGVVGFRRLGRVELAGLGGLDVWWCTVYGGGVFLPMRDVTSARTTYGGGRYVLDTIKGADLGGTPPTPDCTGGRLIVDLNFAYNPSCAYDSAWACPLAPPGNVLDVAVPVGELLRPTGRPAR
jgi:uncharacterized protein (DUF1684 family)